MSRNPRSRARSAPTPRSLHIPRRHSVGSGSSNEKSTEKTLKTIPVSPLGSQRRRRQRRRRSDPTFRPRSRTQHDLKEAGKRYQMYDKVQIRDFLKNVDVHLRKEKASPSTPPSTPPKIRLSETQSPPRVRSMPLTSTPPRRRRLSQNSVPFTSPLRLQRSRSTPSKIHHVRSYVHNVRYEKLVRSMKEVSNASSLSSIRSVLLEVEKRILDAPAAITNKSSEYEGMREKRRVRDSKCLDEVLNCCGKWDALSDDDDDDDDHDSSKRLCDAMRDEEKKSFYSSSSGNLGSWISSRLWGSSSADSENVAHPYYDRLKRLSYDSQRYLDTIQNALKTRSARKKISERRREEALSKWTSRRDLIATWSLSDEAIRRFESRWILTEQRLSLQVQLATSAVEILSRRAQIAKLLRDSHTEMLENIHNVDLKELEEEERSMSSFKVTPRDLLKRDEQREGMKQFVRLVESRIANETDTLISMKPVLEPLPDAHRLIAMRTCVTRLETSDRKWGELFEDIGLSVKDRNLDVCTSNLINTTRDVCKETLTLHRKFQRLLMDSRTVRGETLRNCCGIVRKMYSRFSNSEDCSEILCRLGNFVSHHCTRILAEEVWPDLIMENNDRKTSIPCLQSLVESTLFLNFPRRVVSQNLRDDSSEEEKRKIAWMRTLPLDHFGFSAPKSAMKMLNQMKDDGKTYKPFFPCATSAMETIADAPLSPSVVARRLFRVVQILFLEIRSLFGASTSKTLDSAEILLPGLIVVVLHASRLSRIRDLLVFANTRFVKERGNRTRGRLFSDGTGWIRRGETEYYVTSMLAALSWVDEQKDPEAVKSSKEQRASSSDLCHDYEALLAVFDEATEVSPTVTVRKSVDSSGGSSFDVVL